MPTTGPAELRLRRRSKDLTQRALGDRLGVTDSAVSDWERGISTPARNHALAADELLDAGGAIAAAFGYTAVVSQPDGPGDRLADRVALLSEAVAALTARVASLGAEVDRLRGRKRPGERRSS